MENKRVIEIIQAGMAWVNWTSEQKEAMIIVHESIKKQILQKVSIDGKHSQSCSVCGNGVNGRYCTNCGQRISY